eukprot:UC1_evm1s199
MSTAGSAGAAAATSAAAATLAVPTSTSSAVVVSVPTPSGTAGAATGGTAIAPTGGDGISRERHRSGIVPRIVNIVATVNLNTKLDLRHIALHVRNAEYTPKRFAAVIVRMRVPHTTALIFSSGKMVVTGGKSEEDAWKAARRFARIVQKLGYTDVRFTDYKVQNMVGSCDCKFPIRLEGLAAAHQIFCIYEPEVFPGLVYRMVEPKLVLLVFVSGKIVITGAKSPNHIYEAFET